MKGRWPHPGVIALCAAGAVFGWAVEEWRIERAATRALFRLQVQELRAGAEQASPATPRLPSPSSSELGGAGAQPSRTEVEQLAARLAHNQEVVGSSPTLGTFIPRDVAPGFLPTPEGLWSAVVEPWTQPEFLALPAVAGIVSAVGLPTREDCERALDDRETLSMLETSQALTLALYDLADRCTSRPDALQRACDACAAASRALADRLDRTTGYRHWRMLMDLYEDWSL